MSETRVFGYDNSADKENAGSFALSEPPVGKYKTELCKNWEEKGFCAYGPKCRFAHGIAELHYKDKPNSKYKSRDCESFFQKMYCPYGNRCLFRHDERSLSEITHLYYGLLVKFPYLRDRMPKRRLLAFQEVIDNEKSILLDIYNSQQRSIGQFLDEDDEKYNKPIVS